jgi:enoyl-CoA hydratase/carnithine racemase
MSTEVLIVEEVLVEGASPEGGVISVWTLNRPDKLNALNSDSHIAIKEQCVKAESDDNVRCIVIRGAPPMEPKEGKRAKPPAFAAGADISEFSGKNSDDVRPFFEENAWEAVWNVSKPTIAMVDGFALGGGTELALSCDIRISSERSTFGQPEINLGLIPGGGGTQRLCRLIGYGKTMEIVLSGGMISSDEALEIGIVNRIVSHQELESKTMELAMEIATKSPYVTRVAKRVVRGALDLPFSEGILMERSEFVALFDTEDKEIGVRAFLDRSDPDWVGR